MHSTIHAQNSNKSNISIHLNNKGKKPLQVYISHTLCKSRKQLLVIQGKNKLDNYHMQS